MFSKAVCTPCHDKTSPISALNRSQCVVRLRGLRKSVEVEVKVLMRFQNFKMNDPANSPPNTQKRILEENRCLLRFGYYHRGLSFRSQTDYAGHKRLLCSLYQSVANVLIWSTKLVYSV
ncbi:hypothetical protein TNCV_4554951 [Trichonephila clavipes]|nr:hypothetical protein TNCV_4554951 [Trichonephila clavipes]